MTDTDRPPAALHSEVHPGNGPPILLVHGMLSSRAQWTPNLRALSEVGRPVVIELLGHGRSPSPASANAYEPEAYVAAFERLRESLGADRWFVIGQSLGAALTLRYALDHPDRVIAQVFTNSNSALAPASWVRETEPAMHELARLLEERGQRAVETLSIHPKRARNLPADVRSALVADCALHRAEGIAHTAVHTVLRSSVRDQIATNRVPTLLIRGAREKRFAKQAAHATETMPKLTERAFDAGHAVNIEAAAEFDTAVVQFFRDALR